VTARGDEIIATEPGRHQAFYQGLVAALRGEGPMPVDPRDAVGVLEVIDAARARAAARQVS
jgi:hypothetical protein